MIEGNDRVAQAAELAFENISEIKYDWGENGSGCLFDSYRP